MAAGRSRSGVIASRFSLPMKLFLSIAKPLVPRRTAVGNEPRNGSSAVIRAIAPPHQAGHAILARLEQRAPDRRGQSGIIKLDAQKGPCRALIAPAPGSPDLDSAGHDQEVRGVAPLSPLVGNERD